MHDWLWRDCCWSCPTSKPSFCLKNRLCYTDLRRPSLSPVYRKFRNMMATNVVKEGGRTKASLDLLYHISRELASALELRTVLERVIKLSLENVSGSSGSIIVLDDKGNPVDSIIVVGDKVIEETTEQLRFTLDQGLAGWVRKNRQAALVPDTSRDKRWQKPTRGAEPKAGPKSV